MIYFVWRGINHKSQIINHNMKKEYIKPEIIIENIQFESMLALSTENMGSNEKPGDQNDFNANKRRGTWGNLWE